MPGALDSYANLPGLEIQGLVGLILSYFLASLRIGAFVIASPLFGARAVPVQVRIVIAVMLTLLVVSRVTPPDVADLGTAKLVAVVFTEIALGLGAGMILNIWFAAAALAGEKIAGSTGLGFASQVDPNMGGQTPVVSQFLTMFLTAIFLSMNGHILVLTAMVESYVILPIGTVTGLLVIAQAGIDAAGDMFAAGALIMLPVVSVLLLVNLTIGVITRSSPQLNLFSFGFPITMMVAFVTMYVTVSVMGYALFDLAQAGIRAMMNLLLVLAEG